MYHSIDNKPMSSWPADHVEEQIPGVFEAVAYLARHRPEMLQATVERTSEITHEFGAAIAEHHDIGYRVSVLCLARVSLRHGSTADCYHDYHNETHLLDVLDHLRKISHFQKQHNNPANSEAGIRQLDALSCLCLTLFAAAHDVRQAEVGYGDDGVGHNERASADEAMRILIAVGLDQQAHGHILQLLRWMIYGSTFFSRPMDFGGSSVPPGALAPSIAQQVLERGQRVGEFTAAEAADLVLLATDIDTANVATPIDAYAQQSIRMCREFHRSRDLSGPDPLANRSVLDFLTEGQEHYFFGQQRFYSQLARQTFSADKRMTGELLQQLISWMRKQYDYKGQPGQILPSGKRIMEAFLARATDIGLQARQQTNQHQRSKT